LLQPPASFKIGYQFQERQEMTVKIQETSDGKNVESEENRR